MYFLGKRWSRDSFCCNRTWLSVFPVNYLPFSTSSHHIFPNDSTKSIIWICFSFICCIRFRAQWPLNLITCSLSLHPYSYFGCIDDFCSGCFHLAITWLSLGNQRELATVRCSRGFPVISSQHQTEWVPLLLFVHDLMHITIYAPRHE